MKCDRKRKRSFSGLSFCFVSDFRMPETSNWLVVIYSGHQIAETRTKNKNRSLGSLSRFL